MNTTQISIPITSEYSVLAAGADLKNTICVAFNNEAFLSRCIGNLENSTALEKFCQVLKKLPETLGIIPQIFACDIHPEYFSARYIREENNLPFEEIQHHHAHAVSLLAEHKLEGPAIIWVCDGTGYGLEGVTWGCELLLVDLKGFIRLATLRPSKLPGGDIAIRMPWKQALARLMEIGDRGDVKIWAKKLKIIPEYINEKSLTLLLDQIEKNIASPLSSGLGRLFDSVSAILGICVENSFEAEAAVNLENAAFLTHSLKCKIKLEPIRELPINSPFLDDHSEGLNCFKKKLDTLSPIQLDPTSMLYDILLRRLDGHDVPGLAMAFHCKVAEALTSLMKRMSDLLRVQSLGLSGGCFMNKILKNYITSTLDNILTHNIVSPGDEGISLGQNVCTHARWRKN